MRPMVGRMLVALALMASCHEDLTSGRRFECLADFECGDGWRCARCATGGYGPAGVCVKTGEALSTGCSNDLDIVQGDVANPDVRDATDLPQGHDTHVDDGGTADKPVGSDAPHTDTATEATDPGAVKDDGVTLDTIHDEGVAIDVAKDEGTPPACKQCYGFYECSKACASSDTVCRQACQTDLCAQDVTDLYNFSSCLSTNCAGVTDDAAFNACLTSHCLDAYFTCFSDDLYATCVDLVACQNGCPADDPATTTVNESADCVNACFVGSTFQANKDYQAMQDCARANCPDCTVANPTTAQQESCNTCYSNAQKTAPCQALFQACTAHGTGNCQGIWTCLIPCADTQCAQGCYAGGTFAAQDKVNGFATCGNTACPTGVLDCYETSKTGACKTEWDACLAN